MNKIGSLYIVSTPIGNPGDITLRALETLRQADAVICEEVRIGSTMLKKLGIEGKALVSLNEHNEAEQTPAILTRLFLGESFALISDCGTPVFSDPGHYLIRQASESGISIIPIPGVSSLMAALSILDFKLERFVFGGFLPREPDIRKKELQRLTAMRIPVVLMDTPYRLSRLLEEVSAVFGKQVPITLACDLTLPSESILRGSVADILKTIGKRKAEFILIVHPTILRN